MPHDIDAPLRNGTRTLNPPPQPQRNEIVVYQPDGEMRIEAHFDGETVWLPQSLIAKLFSCSTENVRLHLKNIYACGELDEGATSKESLEVRREGSRNVARRFAYYNLDAIISIGYRVNSIVGVRFRQWATKVIKERMFLGAVQTARFDAMDRRLFAHDKDIAELKEKVDFFVRTQTPPLQGVFYDRQLWDARAFVDRLVKSARKSLLLVDNFSRMPSRDSVAGGIRRFSASLAPSLFRERSTCSRCPVSSSSRPPAVARRDAAIPIRPAPAACCRARGRVSRFGASLKDLSKKCFGFTRMDAAEIPGLKARL